MMLFFKKTLLLAWVAALATLGVASLPLFNVSAQGMNDPVPPPHGQITNERLERLWARQLRAYERLGRTEGFIEKIQKLIDHAEVNGKDASAVQTALDAFEEAVKGAKPIYASMNGIVNSHQGFDEDGNVTDPDKARETVQQMREKLQAIREAMGGTGRALRDAIKAFRQANPRLERTPQP